MHLRVRLDCTRVLAALSMLALAIALAPDAARAQTSKMPETVIYSFGFGPGSTTCTNVVDGADPKGALTVANGLLFGRTSKTTFSGNGDGIIFQIMPNGTQYQIDHLFTGAPSDGDQPRHNAMTLDGTVLYGTTLTGGAHDIGTIFSINDDGTGYSTLFSFGKSKKNKKNNQGDQPGSCFALSNSVLYGMTSLGGKKGGVNGDGTIFSFDPGSATYTKLFSFNGVHNAGSNPRGQPIMDPNGTTLYGMTRSGGNDNVGVIFAFDVSSRKYKKLHDFVCPGLPPGTCMDNKDGAQSDHGTLVQLGSTLFGLTTVGGKFGEGTIFSIGTGGQNFQILHSFGPSNSNDGENPDGSLLLLGGTLYGTTRFGGNTGNGTVFQIDTDGTNYARVHDFHGAPDGSNPVDDVTEDNGNLYGMTEGGGACGNGAIFEIQLQ